MQYSWDQVLKMAPDDASARAGQQLATNTKWVKKSANRAALWGDCQGSGKTPYKTIVDLTDIAFKCSCPSRKFPCKHGLGLMLLYTRHPDVFTTESEIPDHVSEWLSKRGGKEPYKAQPEPKPADDGGKAKRAASREKKVAAGIEELRSWIKDVVRAGIMNVPQNSYQFSQNITARMVDAQAGGLAGQLRQIGNINFYKEGWQRALIRRLAGIYLITDAFQHIENLPEEITGELRTLIGWTTAKEDVLKGSVVSDRWIVLSITSTEEGNITTERIWLYGKKSGRFALILNFYAGNLLPQHLLVQGLQIAADVVYFPGIIPMRALIKEHRTLPEAVIDIETDNSVSSVYEVFAAKLAQNPFIEQMPFLLNEIQVVFKDKILLLLDSNKQGCLIANSDDEFWRMLAFTKGKPCSCFGIYENEQFHIHALWSNQKNFFVK